MLRPRFVSFLEASTVLSNYLQSGLSNPDSTLITRRLSPLVSNCPRTTTLCLTIATKNLEGKKRSVVSLWRVDDRFLGKHIVDQLGVAINRVASLAAPVPNHHPVSSHDCPSLPLPFVQPRARVIIQCRIRIRPPNPGRDPPGAYAPISSPSRHSRSLSRSYIFHGIRRKWCLMPDGSDRV